jgi:prephenate dehydrogenase
MKTLGLLGLGAFGRLMAKHLAAHVDMAACDPSPQAEAFARGHGIAFVPLAEAARRDIVVIATPVEKMREAARAVRPHLQPGAIVMDVGSVKMLPAQILQEELPPDTEIICTHPLFGPQSARDGLVGLKIAVCPLSGNRSRKVLDFLGGVLGLDVIVTTPEAHDRDVALAQGLTHMIAKVLTEMEPLPDRITTRSFDLLIDNGLR